MNEQDIIDALDSTLNNYFGDTLIEVTKDFDNKNVCYIDATEYDEPNVSNKFKITIERE